MTIAAHADGAGIRDYRRYPKSKPCAAWLTNSAC